MAGLVERFEKAKKKREDDKARKHRDKIEAGNERIANQSKTSTGYNTKYAEGWDRIFGKKGVQVTDA